MNGHQSMRRSFAGGSSWFVVVLILFCSISRAAAVAMTDKEILEKIYSETGGKFWTKSTGWMKISNYCNWYGVSCVYEQLQGDEMGDDKSSVDDDDANTTLINANTDDAGEQTASSGSKNTTTTVDDDNLDDDSGTPTTNYGTVAGLMLDGNNLTGTLPLEVFNLPALTKLSVKNNRQLKVPLRSVGNASLLDILVLSNTKTKDLRGLEKASNLTQLHLTNNNLTGTIPSNIFHLTKLQQLFLAFNQLTGSIPADGLYNLTELTDLYLYNNFINGTIPEDIGTKNSNLKYLTLGGNMITGTLPSSLNKLTLLRSISIRNLREDMDLGGVGLSGPLLDFPKSQFLVEVHLNHNNLNGTIPTTFLKKTKTDGRWISINLTSNVLSGSIPVELTRFTNLSLDVTDNRFLTADLPQEFCNKSDWMLGLVSKYGCSAILCPVNTSSPLGRQTKEFKCAPCWLPGSYNQWDDDQPVTDDDADISSSNETFYPPRQTPYLGKLECDRTDAVDVGLSEVALNTSLERDILTELYHATGGKTWGNNDGWLDNTRGICTWYGVQCKIFDSAHSGDANVESLQLQDNLLNGTIPSSIYNLPLLAELNVERNNIFVTFDNIENASNTLESMYIGQTKIDDLSKLIKAVNLTKLVLSRTGIKGPFPEELFSLSNLMELQLENNEITGTLPSKISNWLHMERFDVTKNNFTGSLPSFKKLKSLRILDLSANDWTGTLPSSLNKLEELEVLSIYGSYSKGKLTGSILDFSNCSELVELYLQDQQFSGSIPSTFLRYNQNKDRMVEVNLARNQLTGTLPTELGERFDRLTIEITGNKITKIPSSLCEKDSWMEGEVKFHGCDAIACRAGTYATPFGRATKFLGECKNCFALEDSPFLGNALCAVSNETSTYNATSTTNGTSSSSSAEKDILKLFFQSTNGNNWRNKKYWMDDSKSICTWVGVTCSHGNSETGGVTKLRLEFNELAGYIPSEIFDLPLLEELSLARNKDLNVNFTHIKKATNLTTLYLAETKIVLDGIGKAPSLTVLGIPNSGLAGSFPDEILELTTLQELDLSYNMFNGTLPNGISSLTELTSLLLNNNEFTGSIPTSLGLLTTLKELDLSVNGFEGSLPNELNKLINLEVLAIKNQNNAQGFPSLTGKLLDFQNLTYLTELYLQDNALEGTIPSTFLKNSANKNDSTIYVGLSRNQLSGTVSADLSDLEHLLIALDDNNITGIDSSLCKKKTWMQGNVEKYGCNAILCPAGYYQKFSGRQTTDGMPCTECLLTGGAPYMGSTSCVDKADKIARDILTKLYTSTGGQNWYMNNNWTNPDVPVCHWYGVGCTDEEIKIHSIKLGANNLVGTTPSGLFDLPGLNELWLHSNPVQFNFTGIERANNLTTLLLDGTGLQSLDGLGKGNSLVNLDLSFNLINGTFPYDEISTLVNLKTLSLANNKLTGELISYGFDQLVDLEKIRLDNNLLTGALPDFADFRKLVSLDLSNNFFDSTIPDRFLAGVADTSSPILVSIANNHLTGGISSSVFGRFKKLTLYIKGNKFTSLSEDLCSKGEWNDGDVGLYGCEGLACPPQTSNDVGRRNSDSNICKRCDLANYFGSVDCLPESPSPNAISTSAGISIFRNFPLWIVANLIGFLGTRFFL